MLQASTASTNGEDKRLFCPKDEAAADTLPTATPPSFPLLLGESVLASTSWKEERVWGERSLGRSDGREDGGGGGGGGLRSSLGMGMSMGMGLSGSVEPGGGTSSVEQGDVAQPTAAPPPRRRPALHFELTLTNYRIHVTCQEHVILNLPFAAIDVYEWDKTHLVLETKWGSSFRLPMPEEAHVLSAPPKNGAGVREEKETDDTAKEMEGGSSLLPSDLLGSPLAHSRATVSSPAINSESESISNAKVDGAVCGDGVEDVTEPISVEENSNGCKSTIPSPYRAELVTAFKWIHSAHSRSLRNAASEGAIFAFVHAKAVGNKRPSSKKTVFIENWFSREIDRLGFDLQVAWRVSHLNKNFAHCTSYPEELLVPNSISDAILEKVCNFRSSQRIPAITWRSATTGAVLARSSQPEVGWLGWRSKEDENLIQAIAQSCAFEQSEKRIEKECLDQKPSPGDINDLTSEASVLKQEAKKVLVMDARSYAAAMGNRARGGGVECSEYYDNTEVVFMYLANIHVIRKSFLALRNLCSSADTNGAGGWLQLLEGTKWLQYISGLIKAAIHCATALEDEGRSVLVHCSDGWDRTPQIVSLAQLLLDPYYRTIEGFQTLIAKEWFDFGHKMADRCGSVFGCEDANERSPVFLQWLDCVHQLMLQFPCHFQFNFRFLVKLVQHAYSQLYREFLYNSRKERRQNQEGKSIWDFFHEENESFWRNHLYSAPVGNKATLWPKHEVKDLLLWTAVYCAPDMGGASSVLRWLDKGARETGGEANSGRTGEPMPLAVSTGFAEARNDQESFRERSSPTLIVPSKASPSVSRSNYDGDGLFSIKDAIQCRVEEMVLFHEQEVDNLRAQLKKATTEIRLQANGRSTSLLEDPPNSSGNQSSPDNVVPPAGEEGTSWEQVQENKLTRWVPDHSSDTCMRCHSGFWLGRRKHHCRACGSLVCSNCSENMATLPQEHLYDPVRICDICHQSKISSQTK